MTEDQRVRYQAWFDNAPSLRRLVTELEILSLEASELVGDDRWRR